MTTNNLDKMKPQIINLRDDFYLRQLSISSICPIDSGGEIGIKRT